MDEPEAKVPMSYNDEVRDSIVAGIQQDADPAWLPLSTTAGKMAADAIPDNTLKIDGKFYRAVPHWRDEDGVAMPVNRGTDRYRWEGPEHDDLMEADWRVDS